MRPTLICLSLFITWTAFSQGSVQVSSSKINIGKKTLTGQPIEAIEYTFPERIHDFQIDSTATTMTVELRGVRKEKWLDNKGYIVRFSNDANRVLWSRKVAFQAESIETFGGVTFYSSGGKTYRLDDNNGEKLWQVKNSMIYADADAKIGFGYQIPTAYRNTNTDLVGYNIFTGKDVWTREITQEYGWGSMKYISDSVLLVVAGGLHTINVYNGRGWTVMMKTGRKDYTASAVGTAAGVALGLLTGTFSVATGYDLVRDVNSNVIVDSAAIYFAATEEIIKLDKQGKTLWRTALPADLTSRSIIFKKNGNLFMINRGYAYLSARTVNIGNPYIASFNMETGEKNFFTNASAVKDELIQDYEVAGDTLYLMFRHRVDAYSLKDGNRIITKEIALPAEDGLRSFLADNVYTKKDSSFVNIVHANPGKSFLYSYKGTVMVANKNLAVESTITLDDFYFNYMDRKDLRFMSRKGNTSVLNEKDQEVATLSVSFDVHRVKDKLVFVKGNKLTVIDLAQFD